MNLDGFALAVPCERQCEYCASAKVRRIERKVTAVHGPIGQHNRRIALVEQFLLALTVREVSIQTKRTLPLPDIANVITIRRPCGRRRGFTFAADADSRLLTGRDINNPDI